jgi:hypothetical protein
MYLALKRFAESSMGPEDQTLLTLIEALWSGHFTLPQTLNPALPPFELDFSLNCSIVALALLRTNLIDSPQISWNSWGRCKTRRLACNDLRIASVVDQARNFLRLP